MTGPILPLFHEKFSSSKAPLLEHCAHFASPEAEWAEDAGSPEARFGLAVHRVAELAIEAKVSGTPLEDVPVASVADTFDLDDASAERLFRFAPNICAFIEQNASETWLVERPFAWDPMSGRAMALPLLGHRSYEGKPQGWIGTTLDVVAAVTKDRALVLDFKSGYRRVRKPRENRQLLTQACAAAEVYDASEVLLVVAKIDENGFSLDEDLLGLDDLASHTVWMREKLMGARAAAPVPGPHCTELYCPMRATCPGILGQLERAHGDLVPTTGESFVFGPPTSPEHARWLVSALALVETGVAALTKALNAYADANNGIPCGDKVYRAVTTPKSAPDLSKSGAVELLESFGCGRAVDRSPSTTWKDITAALGSVKAKELRAALTKLGAVKASSSKSYKLVDP